MSANSGYEPGIGCPVFSSDGHKLGTVKEVRGRYFKLDVHMRPDYWLNMDSVATATPESMTLNVSKDHVGDVTFSAPEGVNAPAAGGYTTYPAMSEGPAPAATAPIGEGTYQASGTTKNAPAGYASFNSWDQASPDFRHNWE